MPIQAKSHRAIKEHKKSRWGCIACKRRKVKCDEARPACTACCLRKADCHYPSDSDSNGLIRLSRTQYDGDPREREDLTATQSYSGKTLYKDACCAETDTSPAAGTSLAGPLVRVSGMDATDNKMLRFLIANTCDSLGQANRMPGGFGYTMRTAVVREALEHPFLMETLLALAAQHMQHSGQSVDEKRLLVHRRDAFRLYRTAVQKADPRTFSALLATSLIIQVLPTTEFRDPFAKDLYMIEWMQMWRGIGHIYDLFKHVVPVPSGGVMNLLVRPPVDPHSTRTSAVVPVSLRRVFNEMALQNMDDAEVAMYREVLNCLGSLYEALASCGVDDSMTVRVVTWPTWLPNEFGTAAQQRKPLSLLILAHYGAFVKLLDHVWWSRGIGDRTIRDVCTCLGPQWRLALDVPVAVAKATGQAEAMQILTQAPKQ